MNNNIPIPSQDAPSSAPANNGAQTQTPVPAASESDIIAIKRAHEAEVAKLTQRVAELSNEVTSLRTATAAVEAIKQELAQTKEESAALALKHTEAIKALDVANSESLEARKRALAQYGVAPEALKDLSLDNIRALESVLPTVKSRPASASNLDTANAQGGTPVDLSPRELIRQGLGT